MTISTVLELSTGNVSEAAAELFDMTYDDKPTNVKMPYMSCDYGWLFSVPDADDMAGVEMVKCGGFTAAIKLAQEKGADFVMFDRDADGAAYGLEQFEW